MWPIAALACSPPYIAPPPAPTHWFIERYTLGAAQPPLPKQTKIWVSDTGTTIWLESETDLDVLVDAATPALQPSYSLSQRTPPTGYAVGATINDKSASGGQFLPRIEEDPLWGACCDRRVAIGGGGSNVWLGMTAFMPALETLNPLGIAEGRPAPPPALPIGLMLRIGQTLHTVPVTVQFALPTAEERIEASQQQVKYAHSVRQALRSDDQCAAQMGFRRPSPWPMLIFGFLVLFGIGGGIALLRLTRGSLGRHEDRETGR